MKRFTFRSPLYALLSGLVLSACGGMPQDGQPGAENLGSQESALCYGVYVSNLYVSGASTYDGVMSAGGTYAVAGGANAVRLDYYVDGALKYYEERNAPSGDWYFSYGGYSCGPHTFQVYAYPMIIDSAGTRTTCSSSPTQSAVYNSGQACPVQPISTSFSCSRYSTTQIKCTGSASGGTGVFTPQYQEVWSDYPNGWYNGTSMTKYYACRSSPSTTCYSQPAEGGTSAQMLPICPVQPATYAGDYDTLRVEFKVTDSNGSQSSVLSSNTFTCYY